MTRDGYVPAVLRDFSDLTRQELTDRVRYLEILRVKVAYTRERFSPRQVRASGLAIVMSVVVWVHGIGHLQRRQRPVHACVDDALFPFAPDVARPAAGGDFPAGEPQKLTASPHVRRTGCRD